MVRLAGRTAAVRLLMLGLVTAGCSVLPAVAQDNPVLVGTVFKVTDGDTIKVQSNQPHGAQAKAALAKLVNGQRVQLDVVTQDRYERVVAVVYVGDLNVNEQMVKNGHAWAYREYLKDKNYCRWEDQARQQKRGLWALKASDWIYPSDWRRWRRKTIDAVRDYSSETAQRCLSAIGKD